MIHLLRNEQDLIIAYEYIPIPDINECSRNIHNCDEHATCENAPGTFGCFCNNGWEGNGRTCVNINECERVDRQCHPRAVCEDYDGGFVCTCLPGFYGDGATCKDINECTARLHDCDTRVSVCSNHPGGYTCRCKPGFIDLGNGCQGMCVGWEVVIFKCTQIFT